jgi:hypothetical protein
MFYMLYGTNPDETHLWITPHGLITICVGDKSVWSDRMGQLVSSGDGKDAVLLSVSNAIISLSGHVTVLESQQGGIRNFLLTRHAKVFH